MNKKTRSYGFCLNEETYLHVHLHHAAGTSTTNIHGRLLLLLLLIN